MYVPEHFAETRLDELSRIVEQCPLGALVLNGPHGLDANHLPFELDPTGGDRGVLRAHVARANPVWTDARNGDEALVIFRAADAYISPNWYASTREGHPHVPTWNYPVVHVHGHISVRDDEAFVRGVVAQLTHTHEVRSGSPTPWRMTDASEAYIAQMLGAVVGIEIGITRMVGKSKLSQNRDDRDRVGAAEELRTRGERVIADAMRTIAQRARVPEPSTGAARRPSPGTRPE